MSDLDATTPPREPVSTSKPAARRPGPAHNRKINQAKLIQQASAGLSTYDLAKLHGINQSSVQRFLDHHEIQKADTERYKANRADLLSATGSRLQSLLEQVIRSMSMDAEIGVLDALSTGEKGKLARDLSVVQGVLFDKERLERGESTTNVSMVSKMVDSTVSSLYTRKPLIEQEAIQPIVPAPHSGAGSAG